MKKLLSKYVLKIYKSVYRMICAIGIVYGFLYVSLSPASAAVSVSLARNGQALQDIIISNSASVKTQALAADLARYLDLITGGTFVISTGEGGSGIAVGSYKDFPNLDLDGMFDSEDNIRRDEYLLRTHGNGVYLIGATDLGAQHAVWDFLYRLGFRQFFPGKDWEIWPSSPSIDISLNEFESPDYVSRRLAYGTGMTQKASLRTRTAYLQWAARNRMESGFTVIASHAYGNIIRANRDHFINHPEDLLGSGANAKLDATRPTVLSIAANYALDQFTSKPNLDIISMEPSDGGNWRIDSPLGSPSNQATAIANHVANALSQQFPGKKVGMLAYNFHSPPPTFNVNPNVIIMVSEYALKEGLEFDSTLRGWQQRGADVGVTNPTFNIWQSYKDLPGQAPTSDPDLLATKIPHHNRLGARYWNGSTTPGWAPYGLGHYLISRLLWDITNEQRLEELLNDFYNRSFGASAFLMREYYERYLLASGRPLLSEDLIGRMYRKLEEALAIADSPGAIRRIESYIIHVHYLELYLDYQNSSGTERQKNYEAMARYAHSLRNRESDMVSLYGMTNIAATYDKQITLWDANTQGAGIPELTDGDLRLLLNSGISNNQLIGFTPVAFSTDLVPWGDLGGEQTGTFKIKVGGNNRIYLYPKAGQSSFKFTLRGALNYLNYGPVKARLYAKEHAITESIAEAQISADKSPYDIELETPYSGLHWLEFGDGSSGGSEIIWTKSERLALPISTDTRIAFSLPTSNLYFYVPKGTELIGGYSYDTKGLLYFPNGKIAFDFSTGDKPAYFSTSVPAGQDGKWWSFNKSGAGSKLLLTVPPYLATSPEQGLVPREVKQADKP